MERRSVEGREVLLEFRQVGDSVKVTAIDPTTLREVSVVASPRISEAEMIRLALRKLDYVESRKSSAPPVLKTRRPDGGGIDA